MDKIKRAVGHRRRAIGLLGGSFNPPHSGHHLISEKALRCFGLREVWWMLSPGNPLKDHRMLLPLDRRMELAQQLVQHPRIRFTDFEQRRGLRFTADSVAALVSAYPDIRFVWLMGADNLAQIHHWRRWHHIFRALPVGVLARPDYAAAALASPAASTYRAQRLPGPQATRLAWQRPPVWCYLPGALSDASSTALRTERGPTFGSAHV